MIVLLAICQRLSKERFKSKFESCRKQFTPCYITKANYHKLKTSGHNLGYSYSVDGDDYDGYYNFGLSFTDEFEIVILGKTVPCALCETDPEISIPLLIEDQFKELELNYLDSLAWSQKYEIKNLP